MATKTVHKTKVHGLINSLKLFRIASRNPWGNYQCVLPIIIPIDHRMFEMKVSRLSVFWSMWTHQIWNEAFCVICVDQHYFKRLLSHLPRNLSSKSKSNRTSTGVDRAYWYVCVPACVCESEKETDDSFWNCRVFIMVFQNGAKGIFLSTCRVRLVSQNLSYFLSFHHNFPTIEVSADHRNLTPYDQLNKQSNTKQEPDYVKMLSKTGRICSLGDMQLPMKKKIESDHAMANLRKCKEILKEHYLKRRTLGDLPKEGCKGPTFMAKTLSNKLEMIMKHKADRVVTVVDNLKTKITMPHCLGETRMYSTSVLDQKPQPYIHVNRWNMKRPSIKSANDQNIRKNRKLKPF